MPQIYEKLINMGADEGALDDYEVIGGYKVVQTLAELEALKETETIDEKHILTNGSPVYVASEQRVYRWNANTQEFELDKSSGENALIIDENGHLSAVDVVEIEGTTIEGVSSEDLQSVKTELEEKIANIDTSGSDGDYVSQTTFDTTIAELREEITENDVSALNLENGTGKDSLIQKVSGNSDYVNTATGTNCAVFGQRNTVSAKGNLVGGYWNVVNSGAIYNLVAGCFNEVSTSNNVISGGSNTFVKGGNCVVAGTKNELYHSCAIVAGASCINYGYAAIIAGQTNTNNTNGSHSIIAGTYNVNNVNNAIIAGKYNDDTSDAVLAVGNGTSGKARSNAFEVFTDGTAKLYGTPTEDNHVVTKAYVDSVVDTGGTGGVSQTTFDETVAELREEIANSGGSSLPTIDDDGILCF